MGGRGSVQAVINWLVRWDGTTWALSTITQSDHNYDCRSLTWTKERMLTSGSGRTNDSYAHRPVHATDPFYVFWADAVLSHLSPSRLHFGDSQGKNVFPLPDTMPEAAGTPEPVKR